MKTWDVYNARSLYKQYSSYQEGTGKLKNKYNMINDPIQIKRNPVPLRDTNYLKKIGGPMP